MLVCTEERGKEREETREGTAPAVISSERSDSEGGGERKGREGRTGVRDARRQLGREGDEQ